MKKRPIVIDCINVACNYKIAFKAGQEAERLRTKKEIENMKIDIIGNCAYQGADIPKKYIKETVPLLQERNRTLEELKQRLEKEPEKKG